jgi:transglutaminase-like putative cysteine protease
MRFRVRHERHLHAWAEVYIPGGGWRGYDPTHRLPVVDLHVAVAAAPSQAGTMPVEGSFSGAGVAWKMSFRIDIETA